MPASRRGITCRRRRWKRDCVRRELQQQPTPEPDEALDPTLGTATGTHPANVLVDSARLSTPITPAPHLPARSRGGLVVILVERILVERH